MRDIRKMLSELVGVSQLAPAQGRWSFQVEQRSGWAQTCEQGVLIAIAVAASERTAYWLNRVTLLLAAYEHGLDDALQLWRKQWWLWHRYPLQSERVSLEQGLLLQVAMATLLAQQPDEQENTIRLSTPPTIATVAQAQWG